MKTLLESTELDNRSFCFIDDGALGTIQAMECEEAKNEIFHLGSDIEIEIETLVREAGKFFKFNGKYVEEKPTLVQSKGVVLTYQKLDPCLITKLKQTGKQAYIYLWNGIKNIFSKPVKKILQKP